LVIAVLLVGGLALAGCSSGDDGEAAAGATRATTSTAAPINEGAAGATTPPSSSPAATATTAAQPRTTVASNAAAPTTTTPQPPITVRFSSSCARAGTPQTITIRTTPKAGVVYHAVYADGNNAMSKPYYGGNKGGNADDHGTWSDTWTIGAGAPAGPVTVHVGAITSTAKRFTSATFSVADATGKCG
jgi:hypothetical protein